MNEPPRSAWDEEKALADAEASRERARPPLERAEQAASDENAAHPAARWLSVTAGALIMLAAGLAWLARC